MRTIKTYSELIEIPEFEDRFEYAKLGGTVGEETFGGHRYLNQILYKSRDWKTTRREVMLRDDGYDLAHLDYPIAGNIYIHHLNPITIDDILEKRDCVFDPEYLISTSLNTHNAMHYGDKDILAKGPAIRTKNDTCPWR
jgi:hypothetical protein